MRSIGCQFDLLMSWYSHVFHLVQGRVSLRSLIWRLYLLILVAGIHGACGGMDPQTTVNLSQQRNAKIAFLPANSELIVFARLNPCLCGDGLEERSLDLEILSISETDLLKMISENLEDTSIGLLLSPEDRDEISRGERGRISDLSFSWEEHLKFTEQLRLRKSSFVSSRSWERVALHTLEGSPLMPEEVSIGRSKLWKAIKTRWSSHGQADLLLKIRTHELYTLRNGHRLRSVSVVGLLGLSDTERALESLLGSEDVPRKMPAP